MIHFVIVDYVLNLPYSEHKTSVISSYCHVSWCFMPSQPVQLYQGDHTVTGTCTCVYYICKNNAHYPVLLTFRPFILGDWISVL